MRIVTVAATLALWLAPSAGAAFGPPLVGVPSTLHSLPVLTLHASGGRAPSSCTVHAQRSRGAVGRVERKLAPVACEQPPRSKLLGTGFFILLAP